MTAVQHDGMAAVLLGALLNLAGLPVVAAAAAAAVVVVVVSVRFHREGSDCSQNVL